MSYVKSWHSCLKASLECSRQLADPGIRAGQPAVRLIVLLLKTAHTPESPVAANWGVNYLSPVSLLAYRKKTTRSAHNKNLPLTQRVISNRC